MSIVLVFLGLSITTPISPLPTPSASGWYAESECPKSGKWDITNPNEMWATPATLTFNDGTVINQVAPGTPVTAPATATSVTVTWEGYSTPLTYSRPADCTPPTTTVPTTTITNLSGYCTSTTNFVVNGTSSGNGLIQVFVGDNGLGVLDVVAGVFNFVGSIQSLNSTPPGVNVLLGNEFVGFVPIDFNACIPAPTTTQPAPTTTQPGPTTTVPVTTTPEAPATTVVTTTPPVPTTQPPAPTTPSTLPVTGASDVTVDYSTALGLLAFALGVFCIWASRRRLATK